MVRIQTRTVSKKYKKNQPGYEYKQHLIPIPLSKNEEIKPFLKQRLMSNSPSSLTYSRD
ncbi:MAG: hypothetical protein ABSF44_10365 [Candidatus Bathyarchaeia archaeon]